LQTQTEAEAHARSRAQTITGLSQAKLCSIPRELVRRYTQESKNLAGMIANEETPVTSTEFNRSHPLHSSRIGVLLIEEGLKSNAFVIFGFTRIYRNGLSSNC